MSKISIIQESLDSILQKNYNNTSLDVSCVFFNGEFQLLSTLPIQDTESSSGSLTIQQINEAIQNVQCYGTTNFDKIQDALNILSEFENSKRLIKLIASDGFYSSSILGHNMNEYTLENFFDLSIGVGNTHLDYDKDFLEKIGMKFIHGTDNRLIIDNVRKILYIDDEDTDDDEEENTVEILIPPNLNFISFQEFTKDTIEMSLLENIENADINSYTLQYGQTQTTFTLNRLEIIENCENAHIIIVIDISGSMQDYLLPNNHDEISSDSLMFMLLKSDLTDYTSLKVKKNTDIKFMFSDYNSSQTIFIKNNNIIKKIILEEIVSIDLMNDKVFDICKELKQINELIDHDLSVTWISELYYNNQEIDSKLASYIKDKYSNILNAKEKHFNKLMYETSPPNINRLVNIEMKDDTQEIFLCLICCHNKRNIVLSCHHIVMCDSCAKQMTIQSFKCPICREVTNKIKKCRYVFQNLQCIGTNCNNRISILFNKCNHIYYCSRCYDENNKSCICGLPIESYCSVIFA